MRLVFLVGVLTLVGCGRPAPAMPGPLTVDEWKTLPVADKYTAETFERLKAGQPVLETPEGWKAFERTTLIQARKKDFPGGKRP